MYLACNYGVRAANVPLVAHRELDQHSIETLSKLKTSKVLGLIMNADTLTKVREDRLPFLTGKSEPGEAMADYTDSQRIREDVQYCQRLYRENGWQVVDVTRRAIEEIAHEIVSLIDRRG